MYQHDCDACISLGIGLCDRCWRRKLAMNQQEAYQRLVVLYAEAQQLIKEHNLISAMTSRDQDVPDTLNPDWVVTEKCSRKSSNGLLHEWTVERFKSPLPDDAVQHFMELDGLNEEEVREQYEGQDLNECWIPSQFC